MIWAPFILIASHIVQPAGGVTRPADCIAGPHEPLRVRRLPGVAATTSRPRNPLEDSLPHCTDSGVTSSKDRPEQKPTPREHSR